MYEYDRGGNIQSKKRYAYSEGELGEAQESISYGYDGVWKDKLTAFGGASIQSDALGNVTSDGVWSYTWEGGRRLAGMSKSGTSVSFKYDENGQRIKKVVGSATTEYTVQGKRVVHVKNSTLGEMHIYYDGTRPDMVLYNGATYRYVHSLQGDILGLQDGTGAFVVEYRYDAWGRLLSKTGSLAASLGTLNPFRYRGYVCDDEIGLYYLRSRYYNPDWCRFISSDSILSQVGGLLQHNLWAYCGGNPIGFIDEDGFAFSWYSLRRNDPLYTTQMVGGGGYGSGWIPDIKSSYYTRQAVISYDRAFINSDLNLTPFDIINTFVTGSASGNGKLYYQVTSRESAKSIIATGKLFPRESDYVYVLSKQPSLSEAKLLGARSYETVVSFRSNCTSFIKDPTCIVKGAYYSSNPGPIYVYDIREVPFR